MLRKALRHARARWSLVRRRGGLGPKVRVVSVTSLPASVREAIASPRRTLAPYARLAEAWHEHAEPFIPDYGPYARFLVEERLVGAASALDLACGTGLTTARLAPLFAHVRGVDASAAMLAQARPRLGGLPNVELAQADFRSFTSDRTHDLVTCSADSLNYARTPEELAAAFACVARVLAPGGVFVFDLQSRPSLRRNRLAFWCDDGPRSWWQVHSYHPATGIDSAFTVWRTGVEPHRRRIFTPREVAAAADRAGLVPADRLGGALARFLTGRDFYALKRGPAAGSAGAGPRAAAARRIFSPP